MLRKLLKYDLRANLKIYLFLWPSVLVFACLARLVRISGLSGDVYRIAVSTTTTLSVLGAIAACVFAVIVSIMRFYSGLLRSEGYLMFTLPVKPWQLVLSKFITAILSCGITFAVVFLSSVVFVFGVGETLRVSGRLWSNLSLPEGGTLALALLTLFAALCVFLLQVYVSCSVGHLFRRRRILYSVLTYYGIAICVQFVSVIALTANPFGIWVNTNENLVLCITLLWQVALGLLYFFLTERILRKRLNLE